jgi:hypothetical protein
VARTLGLVTSDQVTGTAEYLAPELLDGAEPDPRADVYSLAVVCYEALTGRPPYTGTVPLAVARAADRGEHDRLDERPDVPAPLARVVEQAMARDPAERFGAADDLARALRATVPAGEVRLPGPATQGPTAAADADPAAGLTTTFGPRPPRPEKEAPHSRRRLPVVLAVVGLVAAGGIALVRGPLASDDADCPEAIRPAPGANALVVSGDVDGDGCSVSGVYQPELLPDGTTTMVLRIALDGTEKRIALGEAGDRVVLGDWDCDGVDTPALHRRAAGEVQYFDVWPSVEARSYQPDAVETVSAGAEIEVADGPGDGQECDTVRVVTTQSEGAGPSDDRIAAFPAGASPTRAVRSAIMDRAGDTTA